MSEALRTYFDSLASYDAIAALVSEGTREDLHLEFKTKYNRSNPLLDDGDARSLSRALSGFANSDGGILVWGVATTKADKIDKASGQKPISAVADFASRLQKSLLSSTQPVVDDVDVRVVPDAADKTAGYVVCFIPASDKVPHRAMAADREYFKRTVDGFYRLEHFDLEDLFGRRPKPKLVVFVEPRRHGEFMVGLENCGRGTAIAPYLEVTLPPACRVSSYGADGNGGFGLLRLPHTGDNDAQPRFGANRSTVIHPGVRHDITIVKGTLEDGMVFDYAVAADGVPLTREALKISTKASG